MTAKAATATPPKAKSRCELWQDTIDGAVADLTWQEYDCDIQRIVAKFNRHLAGTASYRPLNWKLIKAMVWTESGGPNNRAWRDKPIQIGNPGDPGLAALFSANEGGNLIIPPELKNKLTITSAKSSPQVNIAAGIAYLLMRLAKYDVGNVLDERDKKIYEIVVKPGDTFDKIARANGTTIDTLKKSNPGTASLRPGQKLKYQKACTQKIIVRWEAASSSNIARRYNIGDPDYAKKLEYCLSVMRKSKSEESSCA
jgi:LysM repeat protein